MALVTILTTEGYHQFEDDLTFSLHYLPYGKVVVKTDGKYHVGNAVASPQHRTVSFNRQDRNLSPFWEYIDRKIMLLQQQPFITNRASVFSKNEFVALISIIDVPNPVGLAPDSEEEQPNAVAYGLINYEYRDPKYIWMEKFYDAWLTLKQQHGV